MIALHDCNGDVNRAINVLLEGSPDIVSDPCLQHAELRTHTNKYTHVQSYFSHVYSDPTHTNTHSSDITLPIMLCTAVILWVFIMKSFKSLLVLSKPCLRVYESK